MHGAILATWTLPAMNADGVVRTRVTDALLIHLVHVPPSRTSRMRKPVNVKALSVLAIFQHLSRSSL